MNPVVRIVANGPQGPFALCGLTENLLQIPPLGGKRFSAFDPALDDALLHLVLEEGEGDDDRGYEE